MLNEDRIQMVCEMGGGVINYLPEDVMMESGEGFVAKIKRMIASLIQKIKDIFQKRKRKELKDTDKINVPKILHEEIQSFLKALGKFILGITAATVSVKLINALTKSIFKVQQAHKAYKTTKNQQFMKVTRSQIDRNLQAAENLLKNMQEKADYLNNNSTATTKEKQRANADVEKAKAIANDMLVKQAMFDSAPALARKALASSIAIMSLIIGLLGSWSIAVSVGTRVINEKLG